MGHPILPSAQVLPAHRVAVAQPSPPAAGAGRQHAAIQTTSSAGTRTLTAGLASTSKGRHPLSPLAALLKETEKNSGPVKTDEVSAFRSSKESVTALAQEAGIKLEVKPWELLSSIAKDAARGWFVRRAEERGVEWSKSVADFQSRQEDLDRLFTDIEDSDLEYPEYYTMPFHGYDEGNLGWRAAHELQAATQSMSLGYYQGMTWQEAQEIFRGAARNTIADYWRDHCENKDAAEPRTMPLKLLDIGCSGGFSTEQMVKALPNVEAVGLDLSPYFLAVAKLTYPQHNFKHGLAERTGLPDSSADVITFNFLLHELPRATSLAALREAYRLLRPGGMVAVLDVDPRRLLELPPLRRWAFQVTEPWCKDGEYYALDAEQAAKEIGFEQVQASGNDPVNMLVLGRKPR